MLQLSITTSVVYGGKALRAEYPALRAAILRYFISGFCAIIPVNIADSA